MQNRYSRTVKLVAIGAASREEIEQDNTKLRTAEAELEQARLRESRATQLLPISNEVRTASEEALNKLQSAESDLSATRQKLLLYGMPAAHKRSPLYISNHFRARRSFSGERYRHRPVS